MLSLRARRALLLLLPFRREGALALAQPSQLGGVGSAGSVGGGGEWDAGGPAAGAPPPGAAARRNFSAA